MIVARREGMELLVKGIGPRDDEICKGGMCLERLTVVFVV